MNPPKFILASTSQARIRLLAHAGLHFAAKAPHIDEAALQTTIISQEPQEQALILARAKANSLSATNPNQFILGCDQILVCDAKVFHKAENKTEAQSHLKSLRGKTHHLHSALSINKNGTEIFHITQTASMTMRNFTDDFLKTYLETAGSEIIHSVGCYHYEGIGIQLFERVEGDHYTIQGLPLLPLLEFLRSQAIIAQ